MWNRIRQLERSERSLLLKLCQLTPSMQHSQKLDQRLHMLREEVRTMTREKERGEQLWRERLQRCQRQLKSKEDEMSRQSQYFENFKTQLQQKLNLARDKEQSLQNRIFTLEKQLLDMTVSVATGMATIGAVRITAGTITCWEHQERLTSIRGEGEGEEEKKEERRKQWQTSVGIKRDGGREGNKGKTELETAGARSKDPTQISNDSRLQGFILSLQEDIRVLLEREEEGMTERRKLMEQLQDAQEKNHFLGCKVEEMKAEVQQLKLSECSLMEEAEGLREVNRRLDLMIIREAANPNSSQSSPISESTSQSIWTSTDNGSTVVRCVPSRAMLCASEMTQSVWSLGQVQPTSNETEDQPCSCPVSHVHHQAQTTQNNTDSHSSSTKLDPLNLFGHQGSTRNPSHQSLSLTTETVDEFKIGCWCSRGILNLEESPSEESNALREAYSSLGLQKEQSASLEASLEHTQQENMELKFQHINEAKEEETETEQGRGQVDLVQALNQENRALADRIQQLLAHIELREEELKKEETQMREHISSLEENRAKLEQENEEQGCLITELTRKTEDDLNTIMDLQQKLEDSREHYNQEECVDSVVESVLKGAETQLISSQQIGVLNRASAFESQHYDPSGLEQNKPQTNTLDLSSVSEQVDQLTRLTQTVKMEQEQLLSNINSLRQQQREVALSVQTQTEEKQQLTRTVWALKEEKDSISQSLVGLKQDRVELNRTVVGLKDGRDHLVISMTGLKEEMDRLTKISSDLEREKQEMIESLLSGRKEQDQIMQSVQSLQRESDQLRQDVLYLKQERDELNKFLKEQKNQDQPSLPLQEQHNKLIKSVDSLKEEKLQTEHSISCLKQEEKQIRVKIQNLRDERNSLQTPLTSQILTEERKPIDCLLNPNCVDLINKTVTLQTTEYTTQRCQTNDMKGNSIKEQSKLMRKIEVLGEQLKRSGEELEKTEAEAKALRSELCQSEVRREEAERKATEAAEMVKRLTHIASQMEETRKENESLNNQVKELQSTLTDLLSEKTKTLSMKKRTEEQYNTLAAQLKAKTVALEELNAEYINLKQRQSNKDDLSTVLVSLRTRYDDIRAKYDALLRKKSHTDLDIAPLKAKLSFLVVKCQERNSLLVQLMKAMHRHGCVDPTLTQQVEQLLSDAALQDYTAAFTPGRNVKTWGQSFGFTPVFVSKFQDSTNGSSPDLTFSVALPPLNNQHSNGSISKSKGKCKDLNSEKNSSHTASESTTNLQACSYEIKPVTKNANSPVPVSPVQDHTSAQVSPTPAVSVKDGLSTNTTKPSISASGPVHLTSCPEKPVFFYSNIKGKSSPDLTNLTGSSLSAAPASSSTCDNLSRRLSSPEKIINLHEQLQKTLMSSFEASVSRGIGQQPRKSLSLSAPAHLSSASLAENLNFGFYRPQPNSLPVTTASVQVATKSLSTNTSATLFSAVSSRSANLTLSPNMFANHPFEAEISETTESVPSGSIASTTVKSISISGTNISISTTPITASTNISDGTHSASPPLTPRATSFDSNILICSDTNPKTTASVTTASRISTSPKVSVFNMTSKMDVAAYDGFTFAASCTQSPHHSPESSKKSARKSTVALEKTKTSRPKPEGPAEVRAVEVIKTVGQRGLMIGWERPPLDELGCSNGTFVYGYRVFVNGDFHKSVMSSACTKCILENMDLSVPVHIDVQTLGSNGLSSNSVHTTYRTDQH